MRLINADKIHPDVRTQRGALAISQGQLAYAETVNAILIPEDATNGEVIKIMFPNAYIEKTTNDGIVFIDNGSGVMHFNKDWWNALYKAESGVKK